MSNPATIQIEHVYPHPPAAVWKALTDPALHARWWAAGNVRPVVGHRFELDMGAWGKQKCEVLEVIPERRLKYLFAAGNLDTTITWDLEPVPEGTRLTMTQEGFDLESPMGRQALEGMKSGWPGLLARMESVL